MPLTRMDAMDKVHAALMQRVERENLTEIAKGADVPYGWLQQFFYKNIAEPGFTKFTKLAQYLGIKPDDLTVE